MIEVLKLAACLSFLLYASYLDLKTRRVPNRVWKLMLLSLSGFLLYEAAHEGMFYLLRILFSFISTFVLAYLLFRRKIFGGADAKVLMVLGILVPIYPLLEFNSRTFPLLGVPPAGLFALTVLGNAFLLTITVPAGFFCYNLLHFSPEMLKKPFYMLFAYLISIRDLQKLMERKKHIRLVERFELNNGKLRSFFAGRGITLNMNMLSRLEEHEEKGLLEGTIWVTPGIPFMVPITAGFILAIVFGDLIYYLMKGVLPYLTFLSGFSE